jgi:hypothetical protein
VSFIQLGQENKGQCESYKKKKKKKKKKKIWGKQMGQKCHISRGVKTKSEIATFIY